MVAAGDAEHAQPVKGDAERERLPGDAAPDRAETGQMDGDEGKRMRIDNIFVVLRIGVCCFVHVKHTASFACDCARVGPTTETCPDCR